MSDQKQTKNSSTETPVSEEKVPSSNGVSGSSEEKKTPQETKGPVILLVEDDPPLVKMYTSKFTNEGFQVLTAPDGEKGLKMALEEKVDFIILDIMMPKLSGLDLLERLRQDPKGKDILVVVLTNLSQAEEKEKALGLGVKEYIVKASLTPGQLAEKVKKYLGQ